MIQHRSVSASSTPAAAAASQSAPPPSAASQSASDSKDSGDASAFLSRANSLLTAPEFAVLRSFLHRSVKLKTAAGTIPISSPTPAPLSAFSGPPLHRAIAMQFELLCLKVREVLIRPDASDRAQLARELSSRLPQRFQSIYSFLVVDQGLSAPEFLQCVKQASNSADYKAFKTLIVDIEKLAKAANQSGEAPSTNEADARVELLLEALFRLLSAIQFIPSKIPVSAPSIYLRFIPKRVAPIFKSLIEKSINTEIIEKALISTMPHTTGTGKRDAELIAGAFTSSSISRHSKDHDKKPKLTQP